MEKNTSGFPMMFEKETRIMEMEIFKHMGRDVYE